MTAAGVGVSVKRGATVIQVTAAVTVAGTVVAVFVAAGVGDAATSAVADSAADSVGAAEGALLVGGTAVAGATTFPATCAPIVGVAVVWAGNTLTVSVRVSSPPV
jgi:hypothetical protein